MAGTGSVSLTLLHWIVAALALLGEPVTPGTDCPCASDRVREAHQSCPAPRAGTSDTTVLAPAARDG